MTLAAAIVVAAGAAHAVALRGAFVWDDVAQIPLNSKLRTVAGLWSFWSSTDQPDYWPVAYSTHWLEWQAFGNWPPGYRAVNIALHAVNALLVWGVLARLRVPAAWFCGLVFAVHPLSVEAVAWILQRKTLLSTTFALSCLLLFLGYLESRRAERLLAAIAMHVAGMLTKSAVVSWPAVLVLAAWWQRRRVERRDLLATVPFWIASLVLGAVGLWFQHYRAIGAEIVRDDGLASRIALAARAVWFYAGKALWPVDLCFNYPRWPLDQIGPAAWLPLAGLAAVYSVAWWFRGTWGRAVLGGLSYYILALAPALGLVNIYFMRYSLVADHWQYLALPGLIALVCGPASLAIARYAPLPRFVSNAAGTGLVAALLVLCVSHATTFAAPDNELLWRRTIACNPDSALAHSNLAGIFFDRGDLAGARRHNEEAHRIDDRNAEIEVALGVISVCEGKIDEAEAHLRRAILLAPDNPYATAGLVMLDAIRGDWRAAFERMPPKFRGQQEQGQMLLWLGRGYRALGRPHDAADVWARAAELIPPSADLEIALAGARYASGDHGGAVERYRRTLDLDPHNLEAMNNLAWIIATRPDLGGDPREALRFAEETIRRAPNPTPSHWDTLAVALAACREFPRAVEMERRAIASLAAEAAQPADEFRRRLELFEQGQPYVER